MYTDVLISTMVITTVIAWSFCSNALNICFMDGASTSTVDFSLIFRQVIRMNTKNNTDKIRANHLKPVLSLPFPKK